MGRVVSSTREPGAGLEWGSARKMLVPLGKLAGRSISQLGPIRRKERPRRRHVETHEGRILRVVVQIEYVT